MVGVEAGGSWGAGALAGSARTSSHSPTPWRGGGTRPYLGKNQTGLVAAEPIPEQMGQFRPIAAVNSNES